VVQLRAARVKQVLARSESLYALGADFNGVSPRSPADQLHRQYSDGRAPACRSTACPYSRFLAVVVRASLCVLALTADLISSSSNRKLGSHSSIRARRRSDHVAAPVLDLRPPEVYILICRRSGSHLDNPNVQRAAGWYVPACRARRDPVAFIGRRVAGAPHVRGRGLRRSPLIYFAFFWAASINHRDHARQSSVRVAMKLVTGRPPSSRKPTPVSLRVLVFLPDGGLTGVRFAAIPFEQELTDTYFVVAHFHRELRRGGVPDPRAGCVHGPEGHGGACTPSGSER